MKVSRNEPCPCGSGEKFKACCGRGENTRAGVAGARILAVIVGIAVVGGVAVAINQFRTSDLGLKPYVYDAKNDRYFDPVHGHMHQGRPPQGAAQSNPTPAGSASDPLDWEYDAAKNQHFDPGHGHWHAGPPPDQAGAVAPAPGTEIPAGDTPTAWDYDAGNDRHWNPNTLTWEPGMPPLEAFTSDVED